MPDAVRIPAGLALEPIDAVALRGHYQLVFGSGLFAVARYVGPQWTFSSGEPIDFTPTHYHVGGRHG